MHVASGKCHFSYSGVEIFIFKFADFSAVDGVCPVGSKLSDVEFVRSLTDLFVGVERYAYPSVLYVGIVLKIIYGGDYLRYAEPCRRLRAELCRQ